MPFDYRANRRANAIQAAVVPALRAEALDLVPVGGGEPELAAHMNTPAMHAATYSPTL